MTPVRIFAVLISCSLTLAPDCVIAAPDVATFDSFYAKSWSMSPWGWALAAAAAVAAAAALFFFAPVAGPAVAGAGTWLGGMFGFSGVAATNFGLALLGGGSLASGGFGMLGGTALLTAGFAFTTDVAVDFAAGKAIEKYHYARFVENSRDMVTLPLPRNETGPKSYQNAMELLQHIDEGAPLTSPDNRAVIIAAIAAMQNPTESLDSEDIARRQSMLGLLNFIAGDYKAARVHAAEAIDVGQKIKGEITLPAFVYATVLLYEPTIDHDKSLQALRYSIANEPDNPLIPLLFAVYLDRLTYRFNDGAAGIDDLDKVGAIASELVLVDIAIASQMALSGRYVTRLYLAQQKVTSLASSKNRSIRSSPKTLRAVHEAFMDYQRLLIGMRTNVSPISMMTEVAAESEVPIRLSGVWEKYCQDQRRLWGLVQDLARHQEMAGRASSASQEILRGAQPAPVVCAGASSTETTVAGTQITVGSVEEMLRLAEVPYEINVKGEFMVEVDLEAGRSQTVFITSESTDDDVLDIPAISSIAFVYAGSQPADLARALQQMNHDSTTGSWIVLEEDGESVLLFSAPIRGIAGAAALREIIGIVAVTADQMEEQMTRKD